MKHGKFGKEFVNNMSTFKKPTFSLILPCYNEGSHIFSSIKEILIVMNGLNSPYEIILIDDKSQDKTVEFIKKIAKTYPHIRTFFHDKNIGRGGTVTEGILKAQGNIVGFIDIDLEVSPIYIPHFFRIIQEKQADVAIARRYYPFGLLPVSGLLRGIMSRCYVHLVNILLNIKIEDTEAGYKFFNKKKILPVLSITNNKYWFWDTEVVVRSLRCNLKIQEVPVLFLKKSQKASTVRLIPDTIAYLKAIYQFKKELKNEV